MPTPRHNTQSIAAILSLSVKYTRVLLRRWRPRADSHWRLTSDEVLDFVKFYHAKPKRRI